LIKGGFSYRARKELGLVGEIWQPSYYDRRVRDFEGGNDPASAQTHAKDTFPASGSATEFPQTALPFYPTGTDSVSEMQKP
jgi:hypothetical protein